MGAVPGDRIEAVPAAPGEGGPAGVARPVTTGDVRAVVRQARERGWRARAVGAGHPSGAFAATDGLAIDLARHRRLLRADPATGAVEVEAGITLRALSDRLAGLGLALGDPGDIGARSVAGALAAGGGGAGGGDLAAQLTSLELVDADGELRRCSASQDPDLWASARVGLGALGVVTTVAIQAVPTFALRAEERTVPLGGAVVALVTGGRGAPREALWAPPSDTARVRHLHPAEHPVEVGAARRWAAGALAGRPGCGLRCGVGRWWPAPAQPAPWRGDGGGPVVDRGYRLLAGSRPPCAAELAYALPVDRLADAVEDLRRAAGGREAGATASVRLRVAPPAGAWLSPEHGRPTAWVAVRQCGSAPGRWWLDAAEEVLADAGGRPDWGSDHGLGAADLAPRYPRWTDWQAVRRRLDPTGMWSSPVLDRVVGPAGGRP